MAERRRRSPPPTVRDMLGLADRGRVLDLLEAVMGGQPAGGAGDH